MQLIGMLDSPYVRRVAIAARLLGLPFEHRPISVFRNFDEIRAVNPAVKVPTLVLDDGTVLMESGLILDHLEAVAGRGFWPGEPASARRLRERRLVGLALAACEKTVQDVYERHARPPEKRHDGWRERIAKQREGAFAALEAELAGAPLAAGEPTHASLMLAITWQFAQIKLESPPAAGHLPAWAALSASMEALPAFLATPADEAADASFAGA
ncbi:MAG: glutathione S-transferase family protein [Burkholderiaceae bacterium]